MSKNYTIKVLTIVLFVSNLPIYAEVDMQKGIFDAAEEIIAFDNKMNRAIIEHNRLSVEEEEEMKLESMVEDFEEIEDGYLLKRDILHPDSTKVVVKLKDRMLTISTTTIEKEVISSELNVSSKTITSTTTTTLFIPHDADETKMQKSYIDGVLKIKFPKKH